MIRSNESWISIALLAAGCLWLLMLAISSGKQLERTASSIQSNLINDDHAIAAQRLIQTLSRPDL